MSSLPGIYPEAVSKGTASLLFNQSGFHYFWLNVTRMEKGTVIKSTGSRYLVRTSDRRTVPCTIRGKFRIQGIRATNPVAVGDHVEFEWVEGGESGIIASIGERSNYIIRKASKLSKEYQLIACNVDLVWLMVSMNMPRTLTAFIDRVLVSTEAYRIPVVLLFNKIDLYGPEDHEEMTRLISVYTAIGYRCMRLSLQTGEGLSEVRRDMKDKVNVITGNSGVGKSTLIRVLDPEIELKIGELSAYHESGKHTTTFAEMFELKGGIRIIDTPGIRGFGTVDIDRAELFHFFPEIFRASEHCRYHNCLHTHEPGCFVQEEVMHGRIAPSRYLNYVSMLEQEEGRYR